MVRVEAEATRTLDLLELPFLESAALANLSYSPQPYSAGGYAVIPAIGSGNMSQDTCMSGAVLRLTQLQCTASWAQTTGQLHSTIGGDIAVGGVIYQLQDPMLVIPHGLVPPWHPRAMLASLPPVSALPHKSAQRHFRAALAGPPQGRCCPV